MKKLNKYFTSMISCIGLCWLVAFANINSAIAQDSTASVMSPADNVKPKLKPVKNTFDDIILIDNQTSQLPLKHTFEFMLQHRFGPVVNGYKDFYGLFAGANMAFKFYYSPINNLNLGIALNEENMQWEGNAKYALLKQSETGGYPVSITYYGNVAMDTRPKEGNFVSDVDRWSFFNQIMIARKVCEKLSLQAGGSLSYYNNIEGYINTEGTVSPKMNNQHIALEFLGKYKISEIFGIIADYDQPMTQHPMNNPHPNLALGIELGTKGHSFQLFGTNYQSTLQQNNNFYNQNDFHKGAWLVGFNLTRRWHL